MGYNESLQESNAALQAILEILQSRSALLDMFYPVGSIYQSTVNKSPAEFIGGTWEQIQDTFLLAAGSTFTAGSQGGEATHTLTAEEMPNHRHYFAGDGSAIVQNDSALNLSGTAYPNRAAITKGAGYSSSGYVTLSTTGGGEAHNNMPPYLAVYMWQRTA